MAEKNANLFSSDAPEENNSPVSSDTAKNPEHLRTETAESS